LCDAAGNKIAVQRFTGRCGLPAAMPPLQPVSMAARSCGQLLPLPSDWPAAVTVVIPRAWRRPLPCWTTTRGETWSPPPRFDPRRMIRPHAAPTCGEPAAALAVGAQPVFRTFRRVRNRSRPRADSRCHRVRRPGRRIGHQSRSRRQPSSRGRQGRRRGRRFGHPSRSCRWRRSPRQLGLA
jgi:hypothetical protein